MDDFDELYDGVSNRPIYIRKNVQSFSNYESLHIEINKKVSIKSLLDLENQNDFNESESSKYGSHITRKDNIASNENEAQWRESRKSKRDSFRCAKEISPANPRTPTILRQFLGESSNSSSYSSLRNCPFSFDAPASHLLKISDLLPSFTSHSKSVNPITSCPALFAKSNVELTPNPITCNEIFTNFIDNLLENPDGRMTNSQNAIIFIFTCFEAYRTIISSFLIVFVPQNCGGYSCTILQNIMPTDDLEVTAISMNIFMALYFCAMFSIERMRETLVKQYFIADKSYPTDKDYLMKMISDMQPDERRKILSLNRVYRIFAQFLLLVFFVNAGISCTVIQKNYLNNTTTTVFVTNALFMINRIYKALKVTSSGEYNIYSAYRTDSILYNRYRSGDWFGNLAKN